MVAEIVVKGLVDGGLRNLEFVRVKLKYAPPPVTAVVNPLIINTSYVSGIEATFKGGV